MSKIALILGGQGRFARHCAKAFRDMDWEIRHFQRGQDDLGSASKGVDVIINGWNPKYPDWAAEVPFLTEQVITAARISGATVLLAGNVYVYGQAPAPWHAGTPHNAVNELAQVRIDMENAYRASGVKTILLRGGDFIDTQKTTNWFESFITNKLDKGIITYPGKMDIKHAWAYLPDFARACVALVEIQDTLPKFADIHFAGYTLTGSELHAALEAITQKELRVKSFPWWAIGLARPVSPMMRALYSMRYLWNTPHSLTNEPLQNFQPTPLEEALRTALRR